MKKFISLLLTVLMVLSLGITGFAEDNAIKVIKDGESIVFDDAKPVLKNGRVMVPFTSIFDALGAEVKYEDGKICGTLEGKEIILVQDSNTAEFIVDGKAEIIDLDVPVFVDPKINRSYVPVSVISLAFGYDVYWDNVGQVVNIINSKKLIDDINSKYQIFNKLMDMDMSSTNMDKTYKTLLDAALDLKVGKATLGTEEDLNVVAKMAVEAISKGLNMSATGNIKIDPNSDVDRLIGMEKGSLTDIPFEFILKAEEGKMYFNTTMDVEGDDTLKNTYYEMTLDKMTMATIDQMLGMIETSDSITIGQLVYDVSWGMKDTLSQIGMDVYTYAKTIDMTYDLMFADELFKTTTSGGTTTYTVDMDKNKMIARALKIYGLGEMDQEMASSLKDISKLNYKMVMAEKSGKLVKSEMMLDMAMNVEGEVMEMSMEVIGDSLNSDIKVAMNIMGIEIDFDMKSVVSESNGKVKEVPESAVIVPIN